MKGFTKAETIGMFLSIAVMAIALAVIRFDSDRLSVNMQDAPQEQVASVVVVDETNANQQAALADAIVAAAPNANLNSLIIDDLKIGEGDEVKAGDTVSVHYIGRLQNGQEFDNSYTRGTPFSFTVGEGKVIKGWDDGLVGMKVGGQRVLVIPANLAYGDKGAGPIPGGATLVFAIELLAKN